MTAPTPPFTGPISAAEDLTAVVARRLGETDTIGAYTVDATIAVLLAEGVVRDEWGVRLTWDDGSGRHEDEWGDWTLEFARDRIAHHHRMRAKFPGGPFGTERMWMVTPSLVHRFVIVTAPEVVT